MSSKAEALKLDIEDLNNLLQLATRQRAKDLLTIEIRKLQTELGEIIECHKITSQKLDHVSSKAPPKCYEVKLNNYGWDQTTTTVKLYITLRNVHKLAPGAITCSFTEHSMDLHIFELDHKNYSLCINDLCEEIVVNNSYFKVKTDMVIITLAKKVCKDWSHVTGVEKRITKSKTLPPSDIDPKEDAYGSLMDMMRNMYETQDDEVKQKIAKAWTEGRQKM